MTAVKTEIAEIRKEKSEMKEKAVTVEIEIDVIAETVDTVEIDEIAVIKETAKVNYIETAVGEIQIQDEADLDHDHEVKST